MPDTPPLARASDPARPRVVSLLPAATEILCAIGGRSLLVGRSHECDHPPDVRALPELTASRIGPVASPHADASAGPQLSQQAIDRAVSESLAQGNSLYTLFADRLAALRPDVILTQDLCEVCSIDLAAVRRVASALPAPPAIVSLNPRGVEDILDDHLRVGDAVGLSSEALDEVVRLRERMARAQELVPPYDDGPVVVFLEWVDPAFCAGHWTVQLIERAGGRDPLNPTKPSGKDSGAAQGPQQGARLAGKSRRLTPEELAPLRPDAVVISPCGVPLEAIPPLLAPLRTQAWFVDSPARQRGRVALVDGNQMFSRPGPRVVDAFEWLVWWIQGRGVCPTGFPWRALEA